MGEGVGGGGNCVVEALYGINMPLSNLHRKNLGFCLQNYEGNNHIPIQIWYHSTTLGWRDFQYIQIGI